MNGDAPRPARSPERRPRTWIFQANPAKYRIADSLRAEEEEYWNLRQHAREVAPGDRVLIWLSGKRAGVYALGTVRSAPIDTSDSPAGQAYWNDERAGQRMIPRVRVRYDRVLVDRPLLRDFIACDPDLWNLIILRAPQGTNFTVTEEEWQALRGWLETDVAGEG